MADDKKKKQVASYKNVIESLKDIDSDASVQTKDLLQGTSEDFFRQMFGLEKPKVKKSGELSKGESLQIDEAVDGRDEEKRRVKKQFKLERYLINEEKRTIEEKQGELRLELQAIMVEVKKVAESSEGLAEATQIAMISAPVEPGIYHINFFQNILEFLQSFRKKIDLAATWLTSANKRAEKKNYWSMYKKKGSSFLLSPDHYLSRSAG